MEQTGGDAEELVRSLRNLAGEAEIERVMAMPDGDGKETAMQELLDRVWLQVVPNEGMRAALVQQETEMRDAQEREEAKTALSQSWWQWALACADKKHRKRKLARFNARFNASGRKTACGNTIGRAWNSWRYSDTMHQRNALEKAVCRWHKSSTVQAWNNWRCVHKEKRRRKVFRPLMQRLVREYRLTVKRSVSILVAKKLKVWVRRQKGNRKKEPGGKAQKKGAGTEAKADANRSPRSPSPATSPRSPSPTSGDGGNQQAPSQDQLDLLNKQLHELQAQMLSAPRSERKRLRELVKQKDDEIAAARANLRPGK